MRQASEVRLSPGGRQLVYQRLRVEQPTDAQQARAWLLDVATGRQPQLLPAAASGRLRESHAGICSWRAA